MSRSTAVLVSAVVTGFLMVIATAVAMGVPGAGASDELNPGDANLAEAVASSQEIAAGNELSADQFNSEAIVAAALPTATPVPGIPPEQSEVYLDLEWEMLLAQDRIAELAALTDALQVRETVYLQRVDEANSALQEISQSWSQPTGPGGGVGIPLTSSAPSEPPVGTGGDSGTNALPSTEPAPTATPEPLIVEILPGEEVNSLVGEVASLVGTTVITSYAVWGKSAVVDWGDGTPLQSVSVIQETGEVLGFHVYREPGSYVVYVTAKVNGIESQNWTLVNVDEPEVIVVEPTPTPAPAPTATPAPAPTPTAGQPAPPPPAAQPFGITFDDAAYIGRAISGELWVEKIKIKTEDGQQMFEVVLDEAKVFIDTTTGVILFGEHILSSPVNPVPEPPAGMLNFDQAYSIAVNAQPGTVTEIHQTPTTYRVRVSDVDIYIDAYTGAIQ